LPVREGPTTIQFDSATASSDVSSSWSQGNSGSFFGIFGEGDASSSALSQQFAASHVTGSITFQKYIQFIAAPAGPPAGWYSSAALSAAYSAQTGQAPRVQGASPNWGSTFGPNGNMQWFLTALVVADGIRVTINSDAQYSSDQQTQITQESSGGFWPFYWGSGSSTVTTQVNFKADSSMSYTSSSPTGQPVIIGAFALPASQYLGGHPEMQSFVIPHELRAPRFMSKAAGRR
jgi:hypothetical protein